MKYRIKQVGDRYHPQENSGFLGVWMTIGDEYGYDSLGEARNRIRATIDWEIARKKRDEMKKIVKIHPYP